MRIFRRRIGLVRLALFRTTLQHDINESRYQHRNDWPHNRVWQKGLFITGAGTSTFAAIFKKNAANRIKLRYEPDVKRKLFRRPDNYPFALQGIPAQTIMASGDSDACYHKPGDGAKRSDLANMRRIIRAIAAGSRSLIDGTDMPVLY